MTGGKTAASAHDPLAPILRPSGPPRFPITEAFPALRSHVWVILGGLRCVEYGRTPLRCLGSGLVEGFGSRRVQRRAFQEGMGWAARG